MATTIQDKDLEKDKDQNNTVPSNSQGAIVSGTQSGGNTPPSQGAPTSSGRYTNLKGYLQANQKADVAGKIASNIQDKGAQLQGNLNQAKTNASNQLQTIKSDLSQSKGYIDSALSDPSKADTSKFGNYLNAGQTYGNQASSIAQSLPTSDFNSQAEKLGQYGQAAQSEAGRFTLLKDMFKNPNYTGGKQKLDNLFVQADPNQLQKLKPLADIGKNSQASIQNAMSDLSNQANDVQSQANEAQNYASSQLGNQFQGIKSGIEGTLSQQQAGADAYKTKLQNFLDNIQTYNNQNTNIGKVSLSALKSMLGPDQQMWGNYEDSINQSGGNILFDNPDQLKADLAQAMSFSGPTAANAINEEQYNKLQALSKLAGTYNPELSNYASQFSGAGNYQLPQNFDVTKYFKNLPFQNKEVQLGGSNKTIKI